MADIDETTVETPSLTVTIPLPDLAVTIRGQLAYTGRTASWLAGFLGMSASSVSHRLSGRISWTQLELEAVAFALRIPRADISPILAMLPPQVGMMQAGQVTLDPSADRPDARHVVVGGPLDDVLQVLDAAAPGTTLGDLDEQLGGAR